MTKEVLVTPAADIQIVFGADGSRAFQVRLAPLPLDTDRKSLDDSLDMVLGAVERQRCKYELADEEDKLREQVDRIRGYEGSMVAVEEAAKARWESEGRRGDWDVSKLSAAERNAREQVLVALQRDRHDGVARQAKIARLREKVDASDSAADHNAGDSEV